MEFAELREAIIAGEFDDQLEDIITAIAGRKKIVNTQKFYAIEEGTRVKIKEQNFKPVYLRGAMATVVERKTTKFVIEFDEDIDDPYMKWAGKRAVVSPDAIEVI
jgi:hypothetical protein